MIAVKNNRKIENAAKLKIFINYNSLLSNANYKKTGGTQMGTCHEMTKGQIYVCEDCGLELQVVNECTSCGTSAEECKHTTCEFICCDKPLKLKT